MPRVERLLAKNYRGASREIDLKFDSSKPIVLIFGENGTGKTTIVDGLDAIANRSVGSLQFKSVGPKITHVPTIGQRAADVTLEITDSMSRTWKLTVGANALSPGPSPLPRVRVLRRETLQGLINAPPTERYEQLRSLIDVGGVEAAEGRLRDALNEANRQLTEASQQRNDAEARLKTAWTGEGEPNADAETWASEVAGSDTRSLTDRAAGTRRVLGLVAGLRSRLDSLRGTKDLAAERRGELDAASAALEELPDLEGAQGVEIVGLLKQAERELLARRAPRDECPVCEQPIPTQHLLDRIHQRLIDLGEYDRRANLHHEAQTRLAAIEKELEQRAGATASAARELLTAETAVALAARLQFSLPECPALASPAELGTNWDREAEALCRGWEGFEEELNQEAEADARRAGQVNLVRSMKKQLDEAIQTSASVNVTVQAVRRAYEVARLARLDFTQKILDDVATECNRLYGQIHPGEPPPLSKLELDRARRASLNQSTQFEGYDDVTPQAYFNEARLDTLGFSFWLAAVKHEPGSHSTILVLDDVFTTIDAQHTQKVAQLIVDESLNFAQVILTTHQRIWRDTYRNPFGPGNLVHLIELQRWTLSRGICAFETPLAVDELKTELLARPFRREHVAIDAGVLLERTLDYLALQYRCRVPRTHDNAYTLAELLSGTANVFKDLELSFPEVDSAGQPYVPERLTSTRSKDIADKLRLNAFVRNQVGAHYNIAGLAISDADVEEFARLTIELAEAVTCPGCRQIPGKRARTHFECSCEAVKRARLAPLEPR